MTAEVESGTEGERLPEAPQPPTYVFFGRNPWNDAWMPWHSLAHRLVRRHRVVYVHDPSRSPRSLVGGADHLRPDGITEVVPFEYPLQRWGFMRSLARRTAASRIRAALPGNAGPIVTVFAPRSHLGMVEALGPDLTIYLAIDDLSRTASGAPDPAFQAWEEAAIRTADLVVGASDLITARLVEKGARTARTLTNGFDEEYLDGRPREVPAALRGMPRPLLGFAGTIRAERLDIPLIEEVVRSRPSFGFAFVGTEVDDSRGSLRLLRAQPNVRFVGFQPRESLPAFIAAFDVAIAPYADTPLNRACSPLKVLDALAMGRPVVLTPARRDLSHLGPGLHCASDVGSFLAAVADAVAEGNAPHISDSRRARIEPHTWVRKSEQFDTMVADAIAEPPGRTDS